MKERKSKDDYYISPEVEEQDARIRKMTLADTVELMESEDYKDRFKAEFYQTRIRMFKLIDTLDKWDAGTLGFAPTSARYLYLMQVKGMGLQLRAMRRRAKIEGIKL